MEQEKENRELAIEGGSDPDEEETDSQQRKTTQLFGKASGGGVRTSLQGKSG